MPIFLEAEVENACLEVLVNGIPLQRFIAGGASGHAQPINELALPGRNTVRLELQSETTTPRQPWRAGETPSADAAAGARIAFYEDGQTPGEDAGEEFARFLWRQSEDPVAALPGGREFTFELPADYPVPAWAEADVLPDEETAAEVAWHVVHAVRGFLERRDLARLMAAAAPLHSTLAQAYGYDPAVKLARESAWWADALPGLPKLAALPEAPTQGFRLIAGGRLWEALAEDWLPAIRGADGPEFAYPLCVGQLGGRWRILL